MQQVTITPSAVEGTVRANPSKSHAQRAIALGALASGETILHHPGMSDDVRAAQEVARAFCNGVERFDDCVVIAGGRRLNNRTWHCGESGFSLRMYTAIAGLFDTPVTLTGQGSLAVRPVDFMADPIRALGGHFTSTAGHLPVTVNGPLVSGHAEVDGSISSQFLSGLLMTLPLLAGDSELTVHDLQSKPYIDLTLSAMARFGVQVTHTDYRKFKIRGDQTYQPVQMHVEGDWSGMAFFVVMGLIAGRVTVTGLDPASTQADRMILEAAGAAGGRVEIQNGTLSCIQSHLEAIEMDISHAPDLFPPLAALCTHCRGTSVLHGVARLTHKESDRFTTLRDEFARLGIGIWKEGDAMMIKGGQPSGGDVQAHGDHRIAMALATAALRASAPVTINGAECVHKSYPRFFEDLVDIGGGVKRMA